MILSFQHKGLERFYYTGDTRGIQAKHAHRLRVILTALTRTKFPDDMNFPGSGLHLLQPKNAGIYAVRVSGNWRVTFRLTEAGVEIVNYHYH